MEFQNESNFHYARSSVIRIYSNWKSLSYSLVDSFTIQAQFENILLLCCASPIGGHGAVFWAFGSDAPSSALDGCAAKWQACNFIA